MNTLFKHILSPFISLPYGGRRRGLFHHFLLSPPGRRRGSRLHFLPSPTGGAGGGLPSPTGGAGGGLGLVLLFLLFLLPLTLSAQRVDVDSPTYVPTMRVGKILLDGDSVQYLEMNNVYCYPPKTFASSRQRQEYNRLVRDVKKVLPIAKEVNDIIIETYEYLQTLPNKKARDQHLKLVEQDIKKTYTPRMKKLTLRQGKLLIKLVYRECQSTGYQLVNAFLGSIKAGFYQAFAWTFGASLMKSYDPEGEDADVERVARLVESGQL